MVLLVPGDELFDHPIADSPGLHPMQVLACPCDDTWIRDYGPLTVLADRRAEWIDFRFDGWGGRCQRPLADALVAELCRLSPFRHLTAMRLPQVLEGGAIDSDGAGTLLATSRSLRRRWPDFRRETAERLLADALGAQRVLWVDHGELLGDQHDAPIDMLARFADPATIVYQGCANPVDPHYPYLRQMAAQLSGFRTSTGGRYRLLELPLPHTIGRGDERVPTAYANFLILNRAVLMPAFGDPVQDATAAAVVGQAFPDREIVPIDSRVLIMRGRGVHACAMQLPTAIRSDTGPTPSKEMNASQ